MSANSLRESARPQRPVLQSNMWRIGDNPDLGELTGEKQEVVDHAIFRSDDGRWHLWACIRGTRVGRLIYAWEGPALTTPRWGRAGIAMRAEARYGESIDDWNGEEWIQAPHVIVHEGVHHMFYGGHRTELGTCQICLARSPDGRAFQRYQDERGYSRVFVGPGEARDPMVLRVGDLFHCYYTGHDPDQRAPCKIYCRTSTDLVHWSDYVAVNWGGSGGDGPWSAECPHVVYRHGYYYLFRTSRYQPPALTHVYCSRDPLDFGRGDDACKIATLQVAAPEIVTLGDQSCISTVEDLRGGVQLCRLGWVDERSA
ncbi:MAG: hypothetical protein JXA74_05950 [Anaerolineae bacterium]|nr:hypothetical protein [Anaerolineae bacterium]